MTFVIRAQITPLKQSNLLFGQPSPLQLLDGFDYERAERERLLKRDASRDASLPEELNWSLNLELPGPDLRYNSGRASFDRYETGELLRLFVEAAETFERLPTGGLQGAYEKDLFIDYPESWGYSVSRLALGLYANGGTYSVRLYAGSGTYRYSHDIHNADLCRAIEVLRGCPRRGRALAKQLWSIAGRGPLAPDDY